VVSGAFPTFEALPSTPTGRQPPTPGLPVLPALFPVERSIQRKQLMVTWQAIGIKAIFSPLDDSVSV
jgi:hypothetical protein